MINEERGEWLERPVSKVIFGLLGIFIILALWELAVGVGIVNELDVPPPSGIVEALIDVAGTGELWSALATTLRHAGGGLLISILFGVPLGILMGLIPTVNAALRPSVEFLRAVPGLMLIPLALLLFGQTDAMVWFLVTKGCLWTLVIQSFYAAQAIDGVALDTARSMRLTRRRYLTSVVFPATLPYMVTGLRITLTLAVLISISVQILIALPGLGFLIVSSQNALQIPNMYAYVVIGGILALSIQLLFGLAEKRMLHWHESQRVTANT